ncbi:hypothetical protein T439DRAFT_379279 [Meredithblackwellia eburnea MCA 4105]
MSFTESAAVPPSPLVLAAEATARAHHAKYDPSHDFHHVQRVRHLSLSIARSLSPLPDLLVVELAALLHDMLDRKYLPPGKESLTAREHLEGFWVPWDDVVISQERRRLVERIVENVSYSKEVKRIKEGKQTQWHEQCPELHCVQDGDKLDAIGAFGVMRCSAYSVVASRPLYAPSAYPSSTPDQPSPPSSSAIDHFSDKLLKLESLMRTDKGKELAKGRTEFLRTFLKQVESEWAELQQ